MKGIRIEGSKKGRLIVVDTDVNIKESNWEIWYVKKLKQKHPCYKEFHTSDGRLHYTKNPKCPVCGDTSCGVFYQDPDEGFWSFMWKCEKGHTRDTRNKPPKCPYCGEDTIYIEYQDCDNDWEVFWACNCEGVINEEKEANNKGYLSLPIDYLLISEGFSKNPYTYRQYQEYRYTSRLYGFYNTYVIGDK